jgi:peroxiredoxin
MRPRAERLPTPIVLACLAVLALSACSAGKPPDKVALGTVLPDARLERLEGGRAASISDYRGKPLIVNFWATWCEPCRREMPELERLSALARERGVTVIGITVDSDVNLAGEFVLRLGLSFPMLVDRDMRYASDALGIDALPVTLVVGADGRLRARLKGAREWTGPEATQALRSVLGVDLAPRSPQRPGRAAR